MFSLVDCRKRTFIRVTWVHVNTVQEQQCRPVHRHLAVRDFFRRLRDAHFNCPETSKMPWSMTDNITVATKTKMHTTVRFFFLFKRIDL